jgi:hypothetical protein
MALWWNFSSRYKSPFRAWRVHCVWVEIPVLHGFVIRPLHTGQVACIRKGRVRQIKMVEKGGSMTNRVLSRGLILLAALAYSFSAWAVPSKKTVHIQHRLQVGDTTLAPGDYTIVVDGSEATFEQGRKVVAKVSCAVKESGTKSPQDVVVYDANAAITEIRYSGQSQVITFTPVAASTPSKSSSSTSGDR